MTTTSENQAPEAQPATRTLLRNRSYMLLMSGLTTEALGAGMALFAVPLIAFALTDSFVMAGVVSAVGQAGAVLALLPAGVIADRVDRRRLLMIMGTLAALAWASAGVVAVLGALTAAHLAAALFVSSVAGVFVEPAVAGAFRSVVPQPQLPTAYAAAQGRDAVASVAAGPLGGVLLGIAYAIPLLAGAVGALATAVCAWFVREPLNEDTAAARTTHPVEALRQGLRYVWSVPLFRMCLGFFAVVNIALNGIIYSTVLELKDSGFSEVSIGLFAASFGVTMLIGAVLAPALVRRFRVGGLTITGLVVIAAAGIVMAVTQTYLGYVVALMVGGLLIPAVNSGLAGYTAAITPPQMQGRFTAVMSMTGLVAGVASPLIGSALLATWGIGVTLTALSALLAATVVVLSLAEPLRRVGLPDTWADDAVEAP